MSIFHKKVKCWECKHYIDKEDAQIVEIEDFRIPIQLLSEFKDDLVKYYCVLHKKPYDVKSFIGHGIISYYKQLEVTEQGEPVGYVKEKCAGCCRCPHD